MGRYRETQLRAVSLYGHGQNRRRERGADPGVLGRKNCGNAIGGRGEGERVPGGQSYHVVAAPLARLAASEEAFGIFYRDGVHLLLRHALVLQIRDRVADVE